MWDTNIGEHNPENPLVVPFVLFECLDSKGRVLGPKDIPELREYRRIRDFPFFDQLIQRIIDVSARDAMNQDIADLWLRAALSEMENHDRHAGYAGLELEQSIMIDEICAWMRGHLLIQQAVQDAHRTYPIRVQERRVMS